MITGTTSSGFAFEIEEDALDDWELLDELAAVDEGDYKHITKVPKMLLGAEQTKALKEHLRGVDGRVSAQDMVTAINDIFEEVNSLKN